MGQAVTPSPTTPGAPRTSAEPPRNTWERVTNACQTVQAVRAQVGHTSSTFPVICGAAEPGFAQLPQSHSTVRTLRPHLGSHL